MPRKNRKERAAPKPRVLNSTLYCYVEPENWEHAKVKGKELFGSHSAYVNALIAKDRGVTPELGAWKAEGEAKARRKTGEGKKSASLTERAGLVNPPSDSNAQQNVPLVPFEGSLEALKEIEKNGLPKFNIPVDPELSKVSSAYFPPRKLIPVEEIEGVPQKSQPVSSVPATEEQLELPLPETPSGQLTFNEEFETYE